MGAAREFKGALGFWHQPISSPDCAGLSVGFVIQMGMKNGSHMCMVLGSTGPHVADHGSRCDEQ